MKISMAEPRNRAPRGTPAVDGDREEFRGKLDSAKKLAKAPRGGKPAASDSESPTPTPTPTPTLAPTPEVQASPATNGIEQLKAMLGVVGGKATPVAAKIAEQVQVAQAAPMAELPQPEQLQALTPLEQAVHDLIGQLADREETKPDGSRVDLDFVPQQASAVIADEAPPPQAVAKAAPVREIAPPPEQLNPSHVNLVIENEGERVVVTVAVRGNDVNVSLRGSDENTAAALARNAGTLDHALRARGLDLTDFSAERDRDPASQQQQRSARDPRRERDGDDARFVLEEHA